MHLTSPATTDPLTSPRYHLPARSRFPLEAAAWMTGLTALAVMDPTAGTAPDLCLFHTLGIPYCPGCGLGRSVAHLLNGSIEASVHAHPLGIPALLLLTARTTRLLTTWIRESCTSRTPDGRIAPWRIFSS